MKKLIKNKKATYEYYLLDEIVAGLILYGTEIKSIREGKVSINNSYCVFKNDGLYLIDSHIAEYNYGNINNHEPKRDRKLLLTKKQLKKLKKKIEEKGLTIIPKNMFINEKGYCKLTICVAKGKKLHDKRTATKDKDLKRENRIKIRL
jgi:SsrA-binding protein